MMKKVVALSVCILVVVIVTTLIIGVFCSQGLSVERYGVCVKKALKTPIKILSLADLHYPLNGVKLEEIIKRVEGEEPDVILLCGDIIDDSAKSTDIATICDFLIKLRKIAPCFAVLGNHETGSKLLKEYLFTLAESHVAVLKNEYKRLEIKGTNVTFMGVKDANELSAKNFPDHEEIEKSDVIVLLAHRCEKFDEYVEGVVIPDLVFSGHAHGGQIRFFGEGLYAPNQGAFPKYSAGVYTKEEVKMFVSKGLGDGKSDFRVFNRYDIISVTVS